MSDVKRYKTGTYVLYSDYAAKEAECARLREAVEDAAKAIEYYKGFMSESEWKEEPCFPQALKRLHKALAGEGKVCSE